MQKTRLVTFLMTMLLAMGIATHASAQESGSLFERALEKLLDSSDAGNTDTQVPQTRQEIQLSFAPLVEQVSNSVVNVYAARLSAPSSPFAGDPFFERFFGGGRPRVQNSLGSGVIVNSEGLVITNYHVIKGADELRVSMADGREFEAKIVLRDEASDIAVIQLEGDEKFPAIRIGDSEGAKVGDLVLAIGNPFGVGQTVTSGIISAVARSTRGVSDFGFFLQTDAAINPGNSGGALVNMAGELIGINTAIYSRSGGSNGIGFAIPSNMVQVAISSSKTGDTLTRPWIGASFQEVSAEIAQSLGMNRPRGALVVGVANDGPAKAAGIEVGDVLLAVNGKRLPHINALDYRLTTVGIGNVAEFLVLHRGDIQKKQIRLEAAPETVPANETRMPNRSALGGAVLANLSPALAQQAKLPTEKTGVVVLEVQRGSPAAANRIRPGDIIREINGREIKRVAEAEKLISRNGRKWLFLVERRGREVVMERNGGFFRQYSR